MAEFPEIFYDGQRPLFYNWDYHPKTGEIGVWLSNLLAWKLISTMQEPVMVLEDDAIPRYDVNEKINLLLQYLPDDFHFAPLYTPSGCIFVNTGNSFIGIEENRVLCRVYQTYCHVAMVYSQQGADRLLWLAEQSGIVAPVDIFTMAAANQGIVNGFQFQNHDDLPFTYDWSSETTIHNTEHLQWQ
jgi:GR25 family glycosyltransferase involved in LPS biosynthesis